MNFGLDKMTCIEDLRRVAKFKVPKMFYDYADSGSWTESTYRANSRDFNEIKFRQKVLVDMEGRRSHYPPCRFVRLKMWRKIRLPRSGFSCM